MPYSGLHAPGPTASPRRTASLVGDKAGIDADHAVLPPPGNAPDARRIAGVEVGQAVDGVVGWRIASASSSNTTSGATGPNLFFQQQRAGLHVAQHRRREEIAAQRVRRGAGQHLSAFVQRVIEQLQHLVARLAVDQRADSARRVRSRCRPAAPPRGRQTSRRTAGKRRAARRTD